MMNNQFAKKTVVVTGAASQQGQTLAYRFALEGAHVVMTDIDPRAGTHSCVELSNQGLSVDFHALDVRQASESIDVVRKVVKEHDCIDVWINNAQVTHTSPAEILPPEDWDETINVMLSGAFYCSQAAGQHMLKQGKGVILNVASIHGYLVNEEYVAMCTAMAGLVMLTQALGVEWAERGVRVAGLAPGRIGSDLNGKNNTIAPADSESYEVRTPMRRMGTYNDIADAALFLASDDASYILAETLIVDGGWASYQLF